MFGNPIAKLITTLKLENHCITLKLPHRVVITGDTEDKTSGDKEKAGDDEQSSDDSSSDVSDMFDEASAKVIPDDEEEEVQYRIEEHKVDIYLHLNAWNNARRYFNAKKHMLEVCFISLCIVSVCMLWCEICTEKEQN